MRERDGLGSWGSFPLCSRFLAGTGTYSIGNAPAVPRAGMPLEAPGTERIRPSGKVDVTLVKGAFSLRLSLRPWVGQGKGQKSSPD